uniref:Phospholipase-like protein n=1 Tax=Tanacetum cinerariifolium TaxID=118510 RepID=A0A6L2JF83_TANCI|nr:phospholipase-like protein [Tanacetum cinerariifolium]
MQRNGNDVKIIDVLALIEDEDKFSKVSKEDAFQLCLLLSLDVIFMGRELVSAVDDVLLSMVDNLDAWNTFPWGLCESLLTPLKEVKSLRGRIFKLESIIQVITLKTNRVKKEESLNKFGPQIEDLLKSTSEDEPNIIDNRSKIVEKDVLMHDNPISQPIYEDFSFDLAVLNGFCNLSQNEDEKDNCEHYKYTYSSKQKDQIIRLAYQRQQNDISKMAVEAEQKIESEIQRWHTRPSDMDWSMASCYFLPLLVQGSMPKFYANNAIYPVGWSNVERMRQCLEENIHVVLKETGVFENKNIDPTKYKISFTHANHVPKHGGVFGDCSVFLCMFLYRLAYVVSLVVDDPIQDVLAYRENFSLLFPAQDVLSFIVVCLSFATLSRLYVILLVT